MNCRLLARPGGRAVWLVRERAAGIARAFGGGGAVAGIDESVDELEDGALIGGRELFDLQPEPAKPKGAEAGVSRSLRGRGARRWRLAGCGRAANPCTRAFLFAVAVTTTCFTLVVDDRILIRMALRDVLVAFPDSAATPLAPLGPTSQFLTARGAPVEGAHLVIGDWPLQRLPADDPLLAEVLAAAKEDEVDGIVTRILSAQHLAAIALALGRAKVKLRALQFVEAEVLDMSTFAAILARHGLTERWGAFARTMLGDR